MKAFHLTELAAARAASGRRYLEFARSRDLSVGLYVLKAGEADLQKPHTEDEVYHVLQGRGTFVAGTERVPVGPGTVLFVPAWEDHRFEDVTEDLAVLVAFGPSESRAP